MSFKDNIDEDGKEFWKAAYEDRVTDIIDACVEKIDELEDRLSKQRDMISGLYEITDALMHRLRAVEHPLIPPAPGFSEREIDSIVATMKRCVEEGVFDKNSTGE